MYEYLVKSIVKVVDGDTVDLELDLGFHCTITERFRLEGIDTPERGQPGFYEATDHLDWLLNWDGVERIYIRTNRQGSFRRWIGRIMTANSDGTSTDVNAQMITDGYAVPYIK